jgi:hypothetical protein
MDTDIRVFKTYAFIEEATALKTLLETNEIPAHIVTVSSGLDSNFSGEFQKEYAIKIQHTDFEKAQMYLEQIAEAQIANVPDGYYLLDFTDEELYELVLKKDEWSEYDYLLAKKLLNERGKPVDEALAQKLNAKRAEQLAQPEQAGAMGGGVFASYAIYTAKKTLPDGRVVNMYSNADRQRAYFRLLIRIIVLVGLFLFAVWRLLQ